MHLVYNNFYAISTKNYYIYYILQDAKIHQIPGGSPGANHNHAAPVILASCLNLGRLHLYYNNVPSDFTLDGNVMHNI